MRRTWDGLIDDERGDVPGWVTHYGLWKPTGVAVAVQDVGTPHRS